MPRDLLLHDDTLTDPGLRPLFAEAGRQVREGTAEVVQVDASRYVVVVDGRSILAGDVLAHTLARATAEGFDVEALVALSERLRVATAWWVVAEPARRWVETVVRDQFFVRPPGDEWGAPPWALRAGVDRAHLDDAWLRYACWLAVGYRRFGASYESLTADEIFRWATLLGSTEPARLKKHGTGTLPADVAGYRDADVTCTANDAFATIRITMRTATPEAYRAALTWLVRLLRTGFPHSYALDFRGPEKVYLPVRGLPRKGVHQLFAAAAAHPDLRPLIADYARAAMHEDAWYENVDEEDPAMPGTFAVGALLLGDDHQQHLALAHAYLTLCDDEHQAVHGRLVSAYVQRHGFTPDAVALLVACVQHIQELAPITGAPALAATPEALTALAAARAQVAADDPDLADWTWQHVVHAIWGRTGTHEPEKVVRRAPADLRDAYRALLPDA